MKLHESEYSRIPSHLKSLFVKIPNAGSDEVLAGFPETKSGAFPANRGVGGIGNNGHKGQRNLDARSTDSGSAARFFATFPLENEECHSQKSANAAESNFPLQSKRVASALSRALEASTPRLALKNLDCREQNTSVSGQQLESVCELITTATMSLEKRFSQGLPPERLTLSDSLANIAATQNPTGTTTIIISLSTSNGFVEVATLSTTETSGALGGAGLNAPRFKYCAKANKTDRAGSKHPTVKPVSLMRWLVRMVTPPGGAILDPFAGSGTTGQAAFEEGFDAILIERDAEYATDIRRRVDCA